MLKVAELSNNPKYFKWDFIHNSDFNIIKYIKEKEWVYDADYAGERISFWVMVKEGNPTLYRCEHEWEWDSWGTDDAFIYNHFEIKEIDKKAISGEARENLRFIV